MLSTFAFPEPRLSKSSKKRGAKEENRSVSDLSDIVKRLSHQVDRLETWSEMGPTKKEAGLDQKASPFANTGNILIDPLSPEVPEAYEALLQELSRNKPTDRSCNCCAAGHLSNSARSSSKIEVSAGIPWLPPPPTQSTWHTVDDPLRNAYAYWCTLMRCLPLLDTAAQRYIRTIGLYAMRQLLEATQQQQGGAASNRADFPRFSSSAAAVSGGNNTHTTTPLLKNSMSCLSFQNHHYNLRQHHHHSPQQQHQHQQQHQSSIMDDIIIDPNRRKADAWVLPSRTSTDHQPWSPTLTMPQSRTFSSPTPTPSSIPGGGGGGGGDMSSSSSSAAGPRVLSATKLKQWFKRHHKIMPGNISSSDVTRGSSQPFLHSSTVYSQPF